MQNINLEASCPPNSPVLSRFASDDSFVTAPSSPICAASQMARLDIDNSSSLYSQDGNEPNRSTSPILYLNDDDLFSPTIPPHMREPLSPITPPPHFDEDSFPFPLPPGMREHPNLDTDSVLDDPRSLPRPLSSESIDDMATKSVDASPSLPPNMRQQLSSPSQALHPDSKPYGQRSPGHGALHEASPSQSPPKAGNTQTARRHPPAVDFRNSPDPVPRCACKFPNPEHRIGLGSSASPAKCSKCDRRLGAIRHESAEKKGE